LTETLAAGDAGGNAFGIGMASGAIGGMKAEEP